jgi:hypothetical protein
MGLILSDVGLDVGVGRGGHLDRGGDGPGQKGEAGSLDHMLVRRDWNCAGPQGNLVLQYQVSRCDLNVCLSQVPLLRTRNNNAMARLPN